MVLVTNHRDRTKASASSDGVIPYFAATSTWQGHTYVVPVRGRDCGNKQSGGCGSGVQVHYEQTVRERVARPRPRTAATSRAAAAAVAYRCTTGKQSGIECKSRRQWFTGALRANS